MSRAKPLAVSYRRVRSFSSAFITIQSRSPRTSFVSRAGSVRRCAASEGRRSPESLSRVEGFGGSSSRIRRRISEYAAWRSLLLLQRRRAGQQLVEQHAQRVDVAARVDVQAAHLGLLGAHVLERADDRAVLR